MHVKKRKTTFFLLTIFLSLVSISCSFRDKTETSCELYEFSGVSMTIPYRILIPISTSGTNKTPVYTIENEINQVFAYIDNVFNSWNPDSELSRFNKHNSTTPFSCSWDLFYFLQWVDHINSATKGYFDPTVETLNVLWKQSLRQENSKKPDEKELQRHMKAASWSTLVFLPSTHAIQKKDPLTQIDLSAVVKGYAVDLLAKKLSHNSWNHSVYVEWGGEIATRGYHPEGRLWKVELMLPARCTNNQQEPLIIDMGNNTIASSGDVFQRWTVSNLSLDATSEEEYTHIFTPGEEKPLERKDYTLSSVSVTHPTSCALADALATALFATKNKNKARTLSRHLVEMYPKISIILLDKEETHPFYIDSKVENNSLDGQLLTED